MKASEKAREEEKDSEVNWDDDDMPDDELEETRGRTDQRKSLNNSIRKQMVMSAERQNEDFKIEVEKFNRDDSPADVPRNIEEELSKNKTGLGPKTSNFSPIVDAKA